jgi:hypothetical protein
VRNRAQRATGGRPAADALHERAIGHAESATKQQPDLARNYAARADLLGRKIGLGGMFTGVRYGPRVEAALRRARELGPDDVDVQLAIGRNRYHTPSAYGGSLEEAIVSFRRAVERDPKRVTARFLAWSSARTSGLARGGYQSIS